MPGLRDQRGFTLVEMLIVVACLGVLSGLAVPRVTHMVSDSKKAKARADIGNMNKALERYFFEHGSYPTSLFNLPPQFVRSYEFKNAYGKVYFYGYQHRTPADPATPVTRFLLADPGPTPGVGGYPPEGGVAGLDFDQSDEAHTWPDPITYPVYISSGE
jgi:type II secretion system protein G